MECGEVCSERRTASHSLRLRRGLRPFVRLGRRPRLLRPLLRLEDLDLGELLGALLDMEDLLLQLSDLRECLGGIGLSRLGRAEGMHGRHYGGRRHLTFGLVHGQATS